MLAIANWIIENLGFLLTLIFAVLPNSPFSTPASPPGSINLGWITWVFDFPTWIKHMAILLTAIYTWYGIRVLARWAKVARD
ncbi:hypothetical protein [Paenibacillus odorifer]|uniref:hypothetical protein n=1 Tax=Paenibacillus odorifer TaxID=189426 RepID=UPI0020BDE39D|nr:hypothetical protein [Paenibacillus odorifer]